MKLNDKYLYINKDRQHIVVYMDKGLVPNHYQMRILNPGWATISCHRDYLFGPVDVSTVKDARIKYPEYFL